MNSVAVSSWALHRTLGRSWWHGPEAPVAAETRQGPGEITLLDLPAALRDHGYDRLELCHFHLPANAPGPHEALRERLADTGVQLQTLLVDAGDLSHPVHGERDRDWIAEWIDAAPRLGTARVRVVAGKQPYSPEAMARAIAGLRRLADRADANGARLVVENWFGLLDAPDAMNELLDALDGRVGLCLDFGNWPAPRKYQDFPQIAARAETCHAKAEFTPDGGLDREDYARCLAVLRDVDYTGPLVLVNEGPESSAPGAAWRALDVQRRALAA